jgi:predicted signal transduction protein with EAL and GGDEF domain
LFAEILDECEIDPATLQLEITEGAMTSNGTYSADRTLRSLKRMGVQLAIDDFGLGYTSAYALDQRRLDHRLVVQHGRELSSGRRCIRPYISASVPADTLHPPQA